MSVIASAVASAVVVAVAAAFVVGAAAEVAPVAALSMRALGAWIAVAVAALASRLAQMSGTWLNSASALSDSIGRRKLSPR